MFKNIDFFNDNIHDKYGCLGQAKVTEIEKCYSALIKSNLSPIISVDNAGVIYLYIENVYRKRAKEILSFIDVNLDNVY